MYYFILLIFNKIFVFQTFIYLSIYISHNHLHPGTSRVHWLRYDDNMVARDTWAKDLYKDFKSKVIKVKNAYTERFHWIFAIDYFCKFIFIMHCHFYNIAINNILLHNLKLYEKIIFSHLQHFFNISSTYWPHYRMTSFDPPALVARPMESCFILLAENFKIYKVFFKFFISLQSLLQRNSFRVDISLSLFSF